MSFTTAFAFWNSGGPPDPPTRENIPCTVRQDFVQGSGKAKSHTAVLITPLGAALRDAHPTGTASTVQVPYPGGTIFTVVFVERERLRQPNKLRVYLSPLVKS